MAKQRAVESLSVCMSVCLSVRPSVYLSVYLSVCLFVYLPVCLLICVRVCVCDCVWRREHVPGSEMGRQSQKVVRAGRQLSRQVEQVAVS